MTELIQGMGDGRGHIQVGVGHDPGQDGGDQDVQHRTDRERREDADRQIALRILGLLGRSGHRIETDIGEEDQRRTGEHPDRVAVGGAREPAEGHEG